jgi:hypothetical protein
MHVLPLPFGLALALIPRREVDKLRDDEPVHYPYEKAIHNREKILSDPRFFIAAR